MDNLNDINFFTSTMFNYHNFLDYTKSYNYIGVHLDYNIDEYQRSISNTFFEFILNPILILEVRSIILYIIEIENLPKEMLPSTIFNSPPKYNCIYIIG